MSALSCRSGLRCLLMAGVVLGCSSVSVVAAPGWLGHRYGRTHHAVAGRPALGRVQPGPDKSASVARATKGLDKSPSKPQPSETTAKPAPTERASVWTSSEGERACFRSRRKLWQNGEGWVVKKVSVCP